MEAVGVHLVFTSLLLCFVSLFVQLIINILVNSFGVNQSLIWGKGSVFAVRDSGINLHGN